ncbi:hypothetical protein [Clostridium sp. BNL1100]|uniref:hypothetical protein n=1 Tax=Clostridium sp. BNL1100 TaxID=755731 RepID=UPI00024A7C97|nr:hypothetical protein [Clostridium sp. BNL1100]AEY65750.1 hypothetical protein Clo1100_1522 [Clostridium sp. BNL1100]
MAKKISLKSEMGKKVTYLVNSSKHQKLDISEEGLLFRAKSRDYMPPASYVNVYQVKQMTIDSNFKVNLTELKEKYPQNERIFEQLIVGANAIIKPGNSITYIRTIFDGLNCFLEFLNSERNLSNICVSNVADIDILVAKSFCNYLLCVYPKLTSNRKRYNVIKRIVNRLQELYPNDPLIGSSLNWPKGPSVNEVVVEGYHPKEMKELWEACIEDIKEVVCFHQNYISIEHELLLEEWNLENIMYYLNVRWEQPNVVRNSKPTPSRVRFILRNLPNAQEFLKQYGYTYNDIYNIYLKNGLELALRGRLPFKTMISQTPDQERATLQFNLVLATLKKQYPLVPFYCDIGEARNILSSKKVLNNDPIGEMINSILRISATKINFMNGTLGKMAVYAAKHFVFDTIYPFLLLALINTGWNLESMLSISDDVDAHITPDLIDPESYVLIHSQKVRGSKDGKQLKKITHRSSKKNRFGTYRLLKYVESIITQYKDSPYYKNCYLWQYITNNKKTSIIRTINNIEVSFTKVSQRFLERHRLKYVSGKTISHPKIRSGYAALRQLLGSTEWEIGEEFGHSNKETIIHYTSDESSNLVQDLVIKKIQKQFINDLKNFKVRVVESKTLKELSKAINEAKTESDKNKMIKNEATKLGLYEKTIVNIIDAGSQKYILVCEDSTKPSWPGFAELVKEGQKCRYFNKCALCSQSIVFPEALQYIARRILDLDKLKSSLISSEWILQYGDEYEAWLQILHSWSNQEQVENAWELAKTGCVILPQIMRGV